MRTISVLKATICILTVLNLCICVSLGISLVFVVSHALGHETCASIATPQDYELSQAHQAPRHRKRVEQETRYILVKNWIAQTSAGAVATTMDIVAQQVANANQLYSQGDSVLLSQALIHNRRVCFHHGHD